MPTNKEKKKPTITPKGIAVWPKLTVPDTKFKPEGEYSIKLKVADGDAGDAEGLIELIRKTQAEAIAMGKKEKGANAKIKLADLPFAPETDSEGNETGFILFKFTMKAHVTPRNGEPFDQRPSLYDAAGKGIDPKGIKVGGGSLVRVSFNPNPWFSALGAGVTLRLLAVQVIELVEFGTRSASSYGFGTEEGGYSAASEETGMPPADEAPDPTDDEF